MKIPFLNHHSASDYWNYFTKNELMDFSLQHINPVFSIKKVFARVINIRKETNECKTIVLRVNNNWKGFQAGQYIPVSIIIKGRKITRFYSISSGNNKEISITIKKQNSGLVSNFIHNQIKLGSILEIGQAEGEFTLEKADGKEVLFIAGGSGITPVYSILEKNKEINAKLLYFNRKFEEILFYNSLKEISQNNIQTHFILTDENREGFKTSFLTKELLEELVPDYRNRKVFLCGPYSLQESVKKIVDKDSLILENFAPYLKTESNSKKEKIQVKLLKSHRTVEIWNDKPILNALEEEGIYPPSGCRMGICHTCSCVKISGEVSNLQEETLNVSESNLVQICINKAKSNLELEI